MAALKQIALAQSYADQENFPAATDAAAQALLLFDGIAVKVAAAMIYIQAGRVDDLVPAKTIADALSQQADAHSRAYGQMLNGMMVQSGLQNEETQTKAILAMRDAASTADLWLIRYQLGKAYLRSGNYTEALDKLTTLKVRSGEATAVFLDDMPTYRLVAELPYWIGRVQEELKTPAARASYEKYVSLRPQGGALAQDAKERTARLN